MVEETTSVISRPSSHEEAEDEYAPVLMAAVREVAQVRASERA